MTATSSENIDFNIRASKTPIVGWNGGRSKSSPDVVKDYDECFKTNTTADLETNPRTAFPPYWDSIKLL